LTRSSSPGVRLPARSTAQSSLLYILGDLVHPSTDAVPTAAFLTALADAGHETHAARQALARSSKAGWITATRQGRETWWALTDRGHRLIADGQQRITDLGREDLTWDGRWVLVMISIPHARRAIRNHVYRYLSWSGFGTPVPGIWVSPHVRNEHGARFAIRHFDLADTSLSFLGTTGSVGLTEAQVVDQAWDLDDLDTHYNDLLHRHRAHDTGSGQAALRAVLAIDADLQQLPLHDPQLPRELVPERSSRDTARQLLAWRANWLVPARRYWASLADRRS
jgi:phenylacetic acid degradation operon negative regulatory protein